MSCSAAQPNTVNFAGEDPAGLEVKRYLDVLPRPHIFEILLIKGSQHLAIRLDERHSRRLARCRTPCRGGLVEVASQVWWESHEA